MMRNSNWHGTSVDPATLSGSNSCPSGLLICKSVLIFFLIFAWLAVGGAWSEEPPTIRVGAYENPPKIYTNDAGVVVGIFPDILDTIAYEEGWRLEYVFGTWTQCLERLEKGDIDIMVDVAYSEARNAHYDFSKETVFLNWGTVYTRSDYALESFMDLSGKTVAVMKGSIHTDGEDGIKRLSEKFELNLSFLEVSNYDEVFKSVDTGVADAGVVNRLFGVLSEANYNIRKSSLLFNPVQLRFAAPKGSSRGSQIMERVDAHLENLKMESDSIYYEIIDSYLSGIEFQRRIKGEMRAVLLTPEEKNWIKTHRTIRVGVDPAYAPYSFTDQDGSYRGVAMDFVNLISRQLGLRMQVVSGLTWPRILEGVSNNTVDVVVTAVQTENHHKYLDFSNVYIPTPLVIMAREDSQTIDGPEDLAGHKVALVKGYASGERVQIEHPSIKPYMVDTPIEGLSAVSVGEADLYIGVLGINDFLSRKYGITNLKIAARYDMRFGGQRFGVRKDWPMLTAILNKALDAVPEKKRISIFNTWISEKSVLNGSAALQQQNALTEEETEWVQHHPLIQFAIDPEFAPFEYISKNGAFSGVASDYIRILNCRLGLNFQLVPGLTWTEAVDNAKRHELDVLPCVAVTEDRKADLEFSDPYLNFHRVIITRVDTPFLTSIEDVAGLKVAVQADSSHEGYLKEHSDIQPILYSTLNEGLRAVSDGRADALVGNIASATFWIRKQNLTNLKVAAPASYEFQKLHFAVRKDWPELVSIINKGLASISISKEQKIRERWIEVEYEPGMNPVLFWKYIIRTAGVAFLVLVVFIGWNFQLKKEIGKRRRIEKNLNYRLDFETLLLEMSSLFINLKTDQIKEQINKALEKIANFVDADSGYVFSISDQGTKYCNTHGWSSDRLKQMDVFREVDALTMPWWVGRLNAGEVFTVSSVSAMPEEAENEKQLIFAVGIRSFVSIPMSMGGKITGFLGVASIQDERQWEEDEIVLLQAMGQIFTNALQRKQAEEALQFSYEELEKRVIERTADLAKANESLQQEINDRKRMEAEKEKLTEQLIQAQKMEAIGTMAGGIAHDFNNILMPILGYAELTQQSLSPGTQTWDYMLQIVAAGKRAKELVRQILTFSRQTDEEFRPIKLEPLIKETLKLMRSSLPSTITISESIQPGVSDIMGSPTQIHQLLMNLCTNAHHAMLDKGGVLSVSLDETTLREEDVTPRLDMAPGDYIRLRVHDTGVGIDAGIQDRILEPYFTTKGANGGTGLGLSMVHGIVKKHKGHLDFYSEPQKGTTVQVLFPKTTITADVEGKEPEQKLIGGCEHIWVLDDDHTIVQMEKRMLQSLGYDVRAFTQCGQLIEEFKENANKVDLVITDMTMPELTGAEVAREIMSLRPDIPIILCSGFNDSIDENKAKAAGIREYLMKPIIMKELADTVRKVLVNHP